MFYKTGMGFYKIARWFYKEEFVKGVCFYLFPNQ
jgi:hypothetical protein